MVIELIFPWSDGFAANTDQDQSTKEEKHHIKFGSFKNLAKSRKV